MAITVSLYNHTAKRFADGSNAVGDTYKVKLLSANAGGFDATHTTLTATGGTEVSNTGYTAGGATLANVTCVTIWVDGVSRATGTSSGSFSGQTNYVGRNNAFTPRNLVGYIDELRITKGVARYTSTFTPSTTAFPNF